MKIIELKKSFLIMGLVSLISVSCSSAFKSVENSDGKKVFNLKYGEDQRNAMDVFLPNHYTAETPLVIIVHGGGWVFGQKEHMWNVRNFLFKNNIPTATINYRLLKGNLTYNEQLEDVGKAVQFAKENAKKWNLNENNIILLGESAGAHLVLLYGYNHPDEIKKIISMSGPTDFYSENYLKSDYFKRSHKIIQKITNAKFNSSADLDKFKKASPLANISDVPTLILQGDKDYLVNSSQGKALDSVLTEKGFRHEFVSMKGAGHVPRLFNSKVRDEIEFPAILKFIKN